MELKEKALIRWSDENNDNTLSELLTKGEFTYLKETAEKWLTLLKRWNKDINPN